MRLWWCLLLLPTVALAETENWPRQYNTGVTAYRSNDFSRSSQLFENATSSTDRILQERALYNLGNADFRLGQTQPQQAQQLWQRALKNYEGALAIDPKDADARFNYGFVKKRLEELKQQQQQKQQNQKQQQDQQNQNKDQQQKQDQQPQPSEKNQQNKDQGQNKDQQQQNQPQGQSQPKPEDQQSEQQKQQQHAGEQPQQQQAKAEQQPQEANGQPQDMDKMQATEMLDHLREDERDWNFFPEMQMKDLKDSSPPAKDW
jgi:Ca-activated chloride channel family protein